MSKLALMGGEKAVKSDPGDISAWTVVNGEMEEAVLDVLRTGNMSGTDITRKFERGFADWHGAKYGLGCSSGTAALHCAFYGIGIGPGDEIICPSITYWASCLPVFSLGGTVVFADIDPDTLCIDPDDIEKRITEKTKAVLVVHSYSRPADMDRISALAEKHGLRIVEDVSHAHGALYKDRIVGTFGDVSAFSCMSGKSFPIGEGGVLLTDDSEIYERAVVFGHYERHGELTLPELKQGAGLPWGGCKYRMHQMSSAVGLVQLEKYPSEMKETDRAMNFFWDMLEDLPGLKATRPPAGSVSTMGGWYASRGHYRCEELGGLSISRFCEALRAEGVGIAPGCNLPLHLHPLLNTVDVYNEGKPTVIANSSSDIRGFGGPLPVSEGIGKKVFSAPWFKKYYPEIIREYADAFRKVIENHEELLAGDTGDTGEIGGWGLFSRR